MTFSQMYHLECYRRWRLARTTRFHLDRDSFHQYKLCLKCKIWQRLTNGRHPCLCNQAIPAGSKRDRSMNFFRWLWAWIKRILFFWKKPTIVKPKDDELERYSIQCADALIEQKK